MVALAGARGVHERGAVRGQRRGHEDKDHEEEAEELFHISITADFYYSKKAGKAQHKAMQREGGEEMTEMEFLESLSKEQAEFYARTLDELCEMLPKKPEETWENAGKTEQQVQHRKMIDAEVKLIHALIGLEELTERIRQAVTTLKTAKKLTNMRDEESGTGFGYVTEKVKAGIEVMWVAQRDIEFCVNRMRMLLGESEMLHREWASEVKKANGHGQ